MNAPSLSKSFSKADVRPNVSKQKEKTVPFSLRLTEAEHAELKQKAGALSMAAYARLKLLSHDADSPKRRYKTKKQYRPSTELAVIGQMLGGLGQSQVASNLDTIANAANVGALPLKPETVTDINEACLAVQDMRRVLIAALGVKAR